MDAYTLDSSPLQKIGRQQQHLGKSLGTWRPYLVGMGIRAITLIIIVGVLIAIGLGLTYTDGLPPSEDYTKLTFDWTLDPSSYLTPFNTTFGPYNILLDGHSHSKYSDGSMNVAQLLDWHIANGYNAVIVSDHNTIRGGLAAEKLALQDDRYKDKIVVIPAIEYSSCRIHMNLINIDKDVTIGPPVPTDEDIQAVIRQVHALGGLVIVNHIPWSNTTEGYYQVARLPDHPSVQDLISWGVDGFEVVHDSTFDYATYQATAANNLIQMVGTDIHSASMGAATWLVAQAANFTRAAIVDALRARRTSFLMDPAGSRRMVYPSTPSKFEMLLPLTGLGSYFGMFYTDYKGMYSFQGTFCQPERLEVHGNVIGWFIFWLFIFMVVYELARFIVILVAAWISDVLSKRRGISM
ncbi:Polymerase/histidinol phosphatase-like protein [Dichotomocladium elegans]|nr:Polymerase/histidinol phosphatase-like protein [Dichotomocladium elegans]